MAVSKKAESKGQMSELKAQLAEGKLQKLYLFFGEETFLINLFISRITELVPDMDFPDFNRMVMDGGECSLMEIGESIEAFPMMTDRKLVVIKDSGAFRSKASAEVRDFYTDKINNLTDDTVLVFRETDVDKRSAVYKAAQKAGWTGEFTHLDDTDIITWVMREAKYLNRKISKENAAYLISLTDRGLQTLKNELLKLSGYTDEEITAPSISKIASRSLEARVFDFCDAIMVQDAGRALVLLDDLKTAKESPYGILYMLFSTFSKILKAQILAERNEPYEAYAAALSVPRFSVKKYIDGAKKFSRDKLCGILMLCVELDLNIKRGNIGQWQAVEKLALYGTEKKRS